MKNSELLETIGKFLYPFIVLFGFYIILNGDISPGGGFQGGTILATAFLTIYIIKSKNIFKIDIIVKGEKLIFLLLLSVAIISYFTKNVMFTNFIPDYLSINFKRVFLVFLNVFIGLKVAFGLIAVFSAFIEEGTPYVQAEAPELYNTEFSYSNKKEETKHDR